MGNLLSVKKELPMEHYHLKEAEWQYIYSYLQEMPRLRTEDRLSMVFYASNLWEME
jgi:hypothetical protein